MDLEHVHHILDAAYAEVLDDSRNQPEGLAAAERCMRQSGLWPWNP